MKKYLPIPVALLRIGEPLPVTVWSTNGQLLLMCHLPGHVAKGMIGQVELRAEPPTGGAGASGPS